MEAALLLTQLVATGVLSCWLTVGVRDNLLHPLMNETYTAQVMEMIRLRQEHPVEYEQVAHRAITDRRIQTLAFRGIVAAEIFATLLLWIGTLGCEHAYSACPRAERQPGACA